MATASLAPAPVVQPENRVARATMAQAGRAVVPQQFRVVLEQKSVAVWAVVVVVAAATRAVAALVVVPMVVAVAAPAK